MSTVRSSPVSVEKHALFRVGSQFWNIRVNFKRFAGLVDIGSHMSLIQLRNGSFLIINPIILNDHSRSEVNCLTDNGTMIEAVIGVHPFHTLAFPSFYEIYPKARYYGTPRHLRRLKQIPWAGSLDDCQIRRKWEPEVEMRIPAGKILLCRVVQNQTL